MNPAMLKGRFMGPAPWTLGYEWGPSAISFSFNLSFVPSFNTRPRLAILECGPAQKCSHRASEKAQRQPPPRAGHSVGPSRPAGQGRARLRGTRMRRQPGAEASGDPERSPRRARSDARVSELRPTDVSFGSDMCAPGSCWVTGQVSPGLCSSPLGLSVSVVFALRRWEFQPS